MPGGETVARYRTYEERKKIQRLWETGATAKEIAGEISASVSSIYAELRRGKTKKRLPDQRLHYDADLAQRRLQEAIERRGNRRTHRPEEQA